MKFLLSILVGGLTLASCSQMGKSKEASPKHTQYTVDQFLGTKCYSHGAFSFDEKRVFYSSDESGVHNVYSKEIGEVAPRQRTHLKDRSAFMLCDLPDNKGFLYSGDKEGDELHHIFLCRPNGTISDLTPYPGTHSQFQRLGHDGQSFFFSSNKRDPKCMDLYEMDIQTSTPSLLFQNDQVFAIEAISFDKRFLSLKKVISSSATELYLYDFEKKQLINLTPKPGDVISLSASFSPDSKTFYFLTDEGSDFTYVKSYSIENKTFETVLKAPWDIVAYGFSDDGRLSFHVINEDGEFRFSIYDLSAHQQVILPKLPDGEIVTATISKNSQKILLGVGGDRSPLNYYCYDLEKKSTYKLTEALSPDMEIEDLVESEHVRYPSYDGLMIPALYYKPHPDQNKKKRAALIWVHGGPAIQSMKGYSPYFQFLVNHGYAVLAVNHRGSTGYGKTFYKAADHRPAEADLDDCIWAKKFLLATGDFDENRIGIFGESFGGYMTLAALAFRPDDMAFGIDLYGISNLPRTLKNIPEWMESNKIFLEDKIGNPEKDQVRLERASPLFHAKSIKKPLLVVQGVNDPRVLKIESDQIVEEVRKNGVPCQYLLFPDEGHGIMKKENKKATLKAMLDFLDKNL
jgi:dipeptidyl aminopeptidase/acylaminoacyl peptidase